MLQADKSISSDDEVNDESVAEDMDIQVAIHTDTLYRWVHSVHHNSVNPSPWSSMSMHPVEAAFFFSDTDAISGGASFSSFLALVGWAYAVGWVDVHVVSKVIGTVDTCLCQ